MIQPPPGDHDGRNRDQSGCVATVPAVPVSKSSSQTVYGRRPTDEACDANAIRRPSGDHAGWTSSQPAWANRRRVVDVVKSSAQSSPSAPLPRSAARRTNANVRPSGDHDGLPITWLLPVAENRSRAPVPSGRTTAIPLPPIIVPCDDVMYWMTV